MKLIQVHRICQAFFLVFFCALCIAVEGDLSVALNDKYELLHSKSLVQSRVKRSADGLPEIRHLTFDGMGRHFHLYLQERQTLLSPSFRVVAINKDLHERIITDEAKQKVFSGFVVGQGAGSTVSAVWEGDELLATIRTSEDVYSLEPSWRHLPRSDNHTMIMYRGSNLNVEKNLGKSYCGFVRGGHDEAEHNASENHWLADEQVHQREKRQSGFSASYSKNTCPLLLVADYRFFEEMGEKSFYKTTSYLISLIDRVDSIYRNTEFGLSVSGFGFEIKEMRIHDEPTKIEEGGSHYNQQKDKWETVDLLEEFSKDSSYKQFCLAHLFTNLPFDGGVLGLAYIGSPRKYTVGGVCSPVYYKDGSATYLNTGWSSSLNHYNRRLLTQEADLVTTHEFGHNWGSEHDPPDEDCSPKSKEGGKYIMYTYSVSGYDTNNRVFSPCSKRSIGAVLKSKAMSCFKKREESFCGNSRVEVGEKCDGGPDGLKGLDECCNSSCQLKDNSECSDMNDVCCSSCKLASSTTPCYDLHGEDASCEQEAFCSGQSAECPEPGNKPNGVPCLENGKCENGRCLSFCETLNKEPCICDKVENSCFWCCKISHNETCEPEKNGSQTINLHNGMPCISGYCEAGKCKAQVQDLVQRIWKIIEDISPSTVIEFMRANIVGTVILLSLVIWIPASCIVSYVDRKRARKERERLDWLRSDNNTLVMPQSEQKIRTVKRKTRHGRPAQGSFIRSQISSPSSKF